MTENIMPRMNSRKFIYILTLLILISISVFFFMKYTDVKNNQADPNKELNSITAKVSKLYDLPEGKSTLATVEDSNRLKSKPFFKDVKNGDKILIYIEAQQAIIYRPSDDLIVNVGPITISDTRATTTTTTTVNSQPESTTASIDVVAKNNDSNATTARLNKDYVSKVTVKQVSSQDSFDATIIVINNLQFVDLGNEIATTLKGTVGEMPEGQIDTGADITIYIKS